LRTTYRQELRHGVQTPSQPNWKRKKVTRSRIEREATCASRSLSICRFASELRVSLCLPRFEDTAA